MCTHSNGNRKLYSDLWVSSRTLNAWIQFLLTRICRCIYEPSAVAYKVMYIMGVCDRPCAYRSTYKSIKWLGIQHIGDVYMHIIGRLRTFTSFLTIRFRLCCTTDTVVLQMIAIWNMRLDNISPYLEEYEESRILFFIQHISATDWMKWTFLIRIV